MKRSLVRLSFLVTLSLAPSSLTIRALAQPTTDARDYEGAGAASNNTVATNVYLRHSTTAQKRNLSTNGVGFRVDYVLKFGKLAVVPFAANLSFADFDLKLYQSSTPNADPTKPATVSSGTRPTAASGPAAGSVRQTGVTDFQFFPALVYTIEEDEANRTHTYFGGNLYTVMPTGTYSTRNAPVNIGENRWTIKPQVMIGQRFAKVLTAEVVANMLFYTDNTSFHPVTALPVGTLSQKNSYNAEFHLGADIHPTMYVSASYYLQALGEKTYTASVPNGIPAAAQSALKAGLAATHINAEKATVHTLRLSWGVHIEEQSLLLLQYQQDLKTSGEESNTRFAGLRFTHFIN